MTARSADAAAIRRRLGAEKSGEIRAWDTGRVAREPDPPARQAEVPAPEVSSEFLRLKASIQQRVVGPCASGCKAHGAQH